MHVVILLRPEIRLIHRLVQINAHSFLEVSLKSEIGVPFRRGIASIPILYIRHPFDDIHHAFGPGDSITELDQLVVVVRHDLCKLCYDEFCFFGCRVVVSDISVNVHLVKGVSKTDARNVVVSERHHVRIAIGHMSEMSFPEPSAYIMKQPKNIGLLGIEPRGLRDFLRAVSRRSAVVPPRSRIVALGLLFFECLSLCSICAILFSLPICLFF